MIELTYSRATDAEDAIQLAGAGEARYLGGGTSRPLMMIDITDSPFATEPWDSEYCALATRADRARTGPQNGIVPGAARVESGMIPSPSPRAASDGSSTNVGHLDASRLSRP